MRKYDFSYINQKRGPLEVVLTEGPVEKHATWGCWSDTVYPCDGWYLHFGDDVVPPMNAPLLITDYSLDFEYGFSEIHVFKFEIVQ